jgi:hypothetical protein
MNTDRKGKFTQLTGRDVYLFPLMCFLTALVPILYPTIMGRGFYFISNDFCEQMLPFLFNFRDAFADGFNTYYWRLDLGTPMIYAYGYYGLGSIFYYPIFLVPRSFMPYIISVIMILKYMVACYTSFFYIKRYTKSPHGAMAGALLYAFSGLQATNIVFYIFHDVTALFPLMLITLDDMIAAEDKKSLQRSGVFFSLAVAINCLTNYVFFIQSVVAVVIYYLFMQRRRILDFIKRTLVIAVFGTVGVGLSGIVFIPSILYIMGNERAGLALSSNLYLYDFGTILYILKGFFLPGDIMLDETALLELVWTSTSCYLPLIGMIFVMAYLFRNRDRISALVICLIIMSFIPVGNGLFLLFTIIYSRWWYFLILLMAVMSSRVLEEPEKYNIRLASFLQCAFIIVLAAAIWLVRDGEGNSLVFHKGRFVLMVVFSLICNAAVFAAEMWRRKRSAAGVDGALQRKYSAIITAGIMICSMITLIFTEYFYRQNSYVTHDEFINIYNAGAVMPDPGDAYRFRNYRNPVILFNRQENAAGLSSYSSTTSNSIIQFDELFDYWDVSRRVNKGFIAGLPELLGGRYLMMSDTHTMERYPDYIYDEDKKLVDTFTVDGSNWYVYEMDACPIGYKTEAVISYSELMSLPVEKRGIALLYASVVDDEEVSELTDLVQEYKASDILGIINENNEFSEGDALFLNPCIRAASQKNTALALKSFERSHSGFSAVSDYDEEALVYFTIPYDEGFKLTVDGEPAHMINSGGLSLLRLPAGEHAISAVYHVKGLIPGMIISAICALALLAVLLLYLCHDRKAI